MNTGLVKVEIIVALDKLKDGIKQAKASVNDFGSSATKSGAAATKMSNDWKLGFAVISVAAVKAAQKVVSAFKDMVNVYADFEQSLANTQSVAKASADDLGLMEEAARRVGRTTRSTATDAANALYYLASAGFTAKESIAALDGVNALAIATNSDLARTSETVATVIRQYNLATSDATKIANTFTAAITSSLATMDKLAKSFEYVGPIAAGLGLSVEETTGALEVLYNKGFSGEKAGRGLRTILVNLADSSSVVNRRLQKLGITFDEINPATNSLADIFDNLRKHQVGAANAAALFGKVSGVQLAALVSQASDAKGGIIELTKAVTGTNAAFDAMKVQMDTLKGSFDKFKNAEEALKITTGKGLEPVLRTIVDTATGFVKALNRLPPVLLDVVSVIAAAGAAIVSLSVTIFALAKGLKLLGISMALAEASFSAIIIPIGIVVGALTALFSAITVINKISLNHAMKEFSDLAIQFKIAQADLKDFYTNAGRAARAVAAMTEGSKSIKDISTYLKQAADLYGFTYLQMIKIAEKNTHLNKQARDQLQVLEQQAEAEKNLKKNKDAELKQLAKEHSAYRGIVGSLKQLNAEREQLFHQRTDKMFDDMTNSFVSAATQAKILGKSFDRTSYLSGIFKADLKQLADQGLGANSKEVKALIKWYDDLQGKYGEVEKTVKTSVNYTQLRIAHEKDLATQLGIIAQKEKLAQETGQKYDAAAKRSQAVQTVLNKMIEEGFTAEGAGLNKVLEDYGKYLTKKEVVNAVTDEYISKLKKLKETILKAGMTQAQLLDYEEAMALRLAKDNGDAIKSVTDYFNAARKKLKQEQEEAAAIKDKTAAVKEFERTEKETEKERKTAADDLAKFLEKSANLTDEYNDKLKREGKTKLQLIELDRQKAVEEADGNVNLIRLINKYYAILKDKEAFKSFVDNFKEAVDKVTQFLDAFDTIFNNSIKNQIDGIQSALDTQIQALNDQEQAELDAVDGTEREKLQRRIKAAQDAYNLNKTQANKDALITAQNELKKYDIRKKYDDKKAKLEKDAKNREAQLQYQADLTSWRLDVTKSLAAAAIAILKSLESQNPIIIGATVIASAAEVAAVASAKPQPPKKFETGGIVPGSSYKGDSTPVLANAGELILNRAQQKAVADDMFNDSQPIVINTNLYLDGKVVATNSAEYYKNGQVII